MFVSSFHPELSDDLRLHQILNQLCVKKKFEIEFLSFLTSYRQL